MYWFVVNMFFIRYVSGIVRYNTIVLNSLFKTLNNKVFCKTPAGHWSREDTASLDEEINSR